MKMLGDELGTASNIKSRVNRLSVLAAITSAQQRLKLYNKVRERPAPLGEEPLARSGLLGAAHPCTSSFFSSTMVLGIDSCRQWH